MTPDPTPPLGAAELAGSDWTWLRTYHTNIRHGDNAADCGDCRVGKCDVPDLVDDWERLRAALTASRAREAALRGLLYRAQAWVEVVAEYPDQWVQGEAACDLDEAITAALAAPAAPAAPESTEKGD